MALSWYPWVSGAPECRLLLLIHIGIIQRTHIIIMVLILPTMPWPLWAGMTITPKPISPPPPRETAPSLSVIAGVPDGEIADTFISLTMMDILAQGVNFAFRNAEPIMNFGRVYQYDPLGWVSSLGYSSTTAWFANMFTAVASEKLTAVSFYAASPNSPYEIYIYKGVTAGVPRSGTLAATQTGTVQMPGYNTISLSSPANLTTGEGFSIVVKLTTPGFNYPIPLNMQYEWLFKRRHSLTRPEFY